MVTAASLKFPSMPPAVIPTPAVEPVPVPEFTVPATAESLPAPSSPLPPAAKDTTSPTPPAPRREVPRWILQARDLDLLEIAEGVGLEMDGDRLRPCSRCGGDAGAEVYRNKKGRTLWRCHSCKTWDKGNLDLVSCALTGEKAGDLEPEPKALLQQWFADQGWCDPVLDRGKDSPAP
jgi:hypothetical protein